MIKLTLTDEQAKIVSTACEFYARVKMGQFNEIRWLCMRDFDATDFSERRDTAERLLWEARRQIYPSLQGAGHSYGIGKFEDADKAFDVYQVIEFALGGKREPFSYYDLPECKRED